VTPEEKQPLTPERQARYVSDGDDLFFGGPPSEPEPAPEAEPEEEAEP